MPQMGYTRPPTTNSSLPGSSNLLPSYDLMGDLATNPSPPTLRQRAGDLAFGVLDKAVALALNPAVRMIGAAREPYNRMTGRPTLTEREAFKGVAQTQLEELLAVRELNPSAYFAQTSPVIQGGSIDFTILEMERMALGLRRSDTDAYCKKMARIGHQYAEAYGHLDPFNPADADEIVAAIHTIVSEQGAYLEEYNTLSDFMELGVGNCHSRFYRLLPILRVVFPGVRIYIRDMATVGDMKGHRQLVFELPSRLAVCINADTFERVEQPNNLDPPELILLLDFLKDHHNDINPPRPLYPIGSEELDRVVGALLNLGVPKDFLVTIIEYRENGLRNMGADTEDLFSFLAEHDLEEAFMESVRERTLEGKAVVERNAELDIQLRSQLRDIGLTGYAVGIMMDSEESDYVDYDVPMALAREKDSVLDQLVAGLHRLRLEEQGVTEVPEHPVFGRSGTATPEVSLPQEEIERLERAMAFVPPEDLEGAGALQSGSEQMDDLARTLQQSAGVIEGIPTLSHDEARDVLATAANAYGISVSDLDPNEARDMGRAIGSNANSENLEQDFDSPISDTRAALAALARTRGIAGTDGLGRGVVGQRVRQGGWRHRVVSDLEHYRGSLGRIESNWGRSFRRSQGSAQRFVRRYAPTMVLTAGVLFYWFGIRELLDGSDAGFDQGVVVMVEEQPDRFVTITFEPQELINEEMTNPEGVPALEEPKDQPDIPKTPAELAEVITENLQMQEAAIQSFLQSEAGSIPNTHDGLMVLGTEIDNLRSLPSRHYVVPRGFSPEEIRRTLVIVAENLKSNGGTDTPLARFQQAVSRTQPQAPMLLSDRAPAFTLYLDLELSSARFLAPDLISSLEELRRLGGPGVRLLINRSAPNFDTVVEKYWQLRVNGEMRYQDTVMVYGTEPDSVVEDYRTIERVYPVPKQGETYTEIVKKTKKKRFWTMLPDRLIILRLLISFFNSLVGRKEVLKTKGIFRRIIGI